MIVELELVKRGSRVRGCIDSSTALHVYKVCAPRRGPNAIIYDLQRRSYLTITSYFSAWVV